MKEWIEELKEALPSNTFKDEYLEDWQIKMRKLIAEIESLEKEIQAITSTFDAREEYIKQLEKKIEELKKVIEALDKIHGIDIEIIIELRAVREAALRVVNNARASGEYNNVLVHVDWIKKLQQVLEAKDK